MIKFGERFGGRREKKEASGWESLEEMGRSSSFENARESRAMSPDVRRMQEQVQRLREMQVAREKALKAFDDNFDNANDAARRAAGRLKGAGN